MSGDPAGELRRVRPPHGGSFGRPPPARRRTFPGRPLGRDAHATGPRNPHAAGGPARRARPVRPRGSAGGGAARPFLASEPLTNRRRTWVRGRTAAVDFAEVVRELAERFPQAERTRPVCDDLDTHGGGSFYTRFPPAEARAPRERTESVHTPQRGPWLNMAEIGLSLSGRQRLSRRIGDADALRGEVAAWTAARDAAGGTVNRQFAAEDARVKLRSLYPSSRPDAVLAGCCKTAFTGRRSGSSDGVRGRGRVRGVFVLGVSGRRPRSSGPVQAGSSFRGRIRLNAAAAVSICCLSFQRPTNRPRTGRGPARRSPPSGRTAPPPSSSPAG